MWFIHAHAQPVRSDWLVQCLSDGRTALGVTVQAKILDLIRDLRTTEGTAV